MDELQQQERGVRALSSAAAALADGFCPAASKRKRLDAAAAFLAPAKRKGSSDFLRKGQWTNTEERLARLLIEAFEDGYLPIYTGIRLRGYLAVQLQCDPMRVSKKLCAGSVDGKQVPKNYGQKKFKLRKKQLWDCDEAERRVTELERLTRAMWSEARMKKPAFLTLSSTRNMNKRRASDDESVSSPPSPVRGRTPSPRAKKQKVFPIIYLNLSKKLKYYSVDSSSGSEPASPSNDSDLDLEPVRLDGESLQAAYDLLTLCSPRGTNKKKSISKGKSRKSKPDVNTDSFIKSEPDENYASSTTTSIDPAEDDASSKDTSSEVAPSELTPIQVSTASCVTPDSPTDPVLANSSPRYNCPMKSELLIKQEPPSL
ncbi:unnamed protein product [Phytophthora lilii]|uniref:Unnamed protein product n=1 Tax=Phytophthora lilii TaxID=2077276 RepID=A0A9W6TPL1_9STRA|nr:unnamed protein product [Phytophthora lilii]